MNVNLATCIKYKLDPNSIFILKCINDRDNDGFLWASQFFKREYFEKNINYLILRRFINMSKPSGYSLEFLSMVKTKRASNKDSSEFGKFVEEYYQLWPKGIMSGGYAVKSGRDACASKLRTFMKKNPLYTQQIILQATSNYIQRCKGNDYQFMKLANYFISKDGISVLETCCEEIVNGTFKQPSKINIELG
jgi:hypothetical protein